MTYSRSHSNKGHLGQEPKSGVTPGPCMSGSLMLAQVGLSAGEVAPRKEESCSDRVQVGGQNLGVRQHGVTITQDLGGAPRGRLRAKAGP